MFTFNTVSRQERIYRAELLDVEADSNWLEVRADQIYQDLMNEKVVLSGGTSYCMDDLLKKVVASPKFKALAIECLTHSESAGYDLRNLISAAGEKLAAELARKEMQ